ncbi:MAG: DUF1800 domain-containing protein [Vicinamibacterales bacterium]
MTTHTTPTRKAAVETVRRFRGSRSDRSAFVRRRGAWGYTVAIVRRRGLWAFATAFAAVFAAADLAIEAARPSTGVTLPATARGDRAIVHALDRLGFGPTPALVAEVRTTGLAQYIDDQLHPERLADAAADARLSAFATLRMSTKELADRFFIPALEERRARRETTTRANEGERARPDGTGERRARPEREERLRRGAPVDAPDRGREETDAVSRDGALVPLAPERGRAERRPEAIVLAELSAQKLVRAAYSERQLQEVLVDFWFNHFNVFAGKGPVRQYVTEYERDAIRPHVLGRFRDLLGATAHSPAMLFYLDNWLSVDPAAADALTTAINPAGGPPDGAPRPGERRGRRRAASAPDARPWPSRGERSASLDRLKARENKLPKGLNENYARELLELHTLGVDGGYTQADVQEVARAFTGWTIDGPRRGGAHRFAPRMHDDRQKLVLGQVIPAGGGERDGEQVLDILARHPSTARFIATKLARRFVGDDPPRALVDRAAARFRETDGDLREVTKLIVTSPEFFAPDAYRSKVKTPFEFVASALRATGADVWNALPLVRAVRDLGMPLYFAQPPTGYKETADIWMNSGALVGRMNFGLALVDGGLRGTTVAVADSTPADLTRALVPGGIAAATAATLEKADGPRQMAALVLGSPEFQKK